MLRKILLILSLAVVALPAAAQPKRAKPAAPAPVVARPTRPALAVAPQRSRSVEVLWGGQWWAAEVLESRAGITRIHYTGWGPEWDEWVGPERIRSVAPAAPAAPLKGARVGQQVDVEWHGSWWPAEVVAMKNGFYKIHYTGWGTEWDEWVELPRLRGRAAPRAKAPAPEIAGQTS
jgi:hypothetical protein